jgi:hypothetical protein
MKLHHLAALGGIVALGGCAQLGATTSTGSSPAQDAAACVAALVPIGIVSGGTALPAAALSTPACTNLAADILQFAISQAQQSIGKTTAALRAARRLQ